MKPRRKGCLLGRRGVCAPGSGCKGFTLIEMMIVVTIVALLALIAIPSYKKVLARSQNARFANDAKVASAGFQMYALENGTYPPDVNRGVLPFGMQPYLMKFHWADPTSLGGQWDWDLDQFGVRAAVSAAGVHVPPAQLMALDKQIDNGDPNSGFILIQGDRVLYVIEE